MPRRALPRRHHLLAGAAVLTLLLGGCERYAGNPLDGFGTFAADVHTLRLNPNKPTAPDENMRKASGDDVKVAALTPESGEVWPDLSRKIPTLQDIQNMQNAEPLPAFTPPNYTPSSLPRIGVPQSSVPGAAAEPAPTPRTFQTSRGPVTTRVTNGVETFQVPGGGIGTVVPNGNGTSNLIGPDGSVTTVPNPR